MNKNIGETGEEKKFFPFWKFSCMQNCADIRAIDIQNVFLLSSANNSKP
jgi:hypothetical protein